MGHSYSEGAQLCHWENTGLEFGVSCGTGVTSMRTLDSQDPTVLSCASRCSTCLGHHPLACLTTGAGNPQHNEKEAATVASVSTHSP